MRSAPRGPARVERAFVGSYEAAALGPLSAAVDSAARSTTGAVGGLAVAWTGPPATAPPSAEHTACLLDGEIYNLDDVARLAGLPAHQAPEATLASAYARLGEDLIAQLRGEFALVLWDARARKGLLARDQLGSGNLFLHVGAGRLLFASELTNLLDALPRTPGPDRSALVHWLAAGTVPVDRTLYEGVVPLPPASILRLEPGRWELAHYWAPCYVEPLRLDVDGAVDELRGAVFRAVGRRLKGRRKAGVLVSGGLDSATVLAVADRLSAANQASLRAYSAVFPAHASMDEGRLVRLQVEHHGLPGVQVPVTGGRPLEAALRYLDTWRVPLPVPGHFMWEPLLRAASRHGTECMLDGELGDELFGAAILLLADRVAQGRVRGAVELARSLPGVGPSPRRRLLGRLLFHYGLAACLPPVLGRVAAGRQAAPSWLRRPEARRFARSRDPEPWRDLEGPRWWAQLADAVVRGPDRLGFSDYFRRRARAVGMPAQHPFLDLDLIQLVLRLPPEHGFDADLSRPVLRRAMHGIVPDEVRLRRGKTYFDPLLADCVAGEDRAVVMQLLGAPDAEVLTLVEPAGVRALVSEWPSRPSGEAVSWTRDIWRLTTAECWLRSQADPSFPRTMHDRWFRGASHSEPSAQGARRSYVCQP
ncbi:MAG TPA: asparagine synthase-related protein [Streptosporangiaceae bacterium]|jgi:asparagine synthase (glutamine-hydrolysing)|nr:asparagine synthase-related protein [Streptosporangiaceae bacterium]